MKSFQSALLAVTASAYGFNSMEGFGYNVGNNYAHGNSHGDHMNQDEILPQTAHDHIIGYDSVQPQTDAVWTANSASMATLAAAIVVAIPVANTARKTYTLSVMNKRLNRLDDIHDDNLVKIDAPFTLQLDLLEEELDDITRARIYATQDADDAKTDLIARMTEFRDDRIRDMNVEAARVMRVLDRAVNDNKFVEDVFYAMRLDWLQGIYTSGVLAFYDATVYDMTHFTGEFDLFTYDIGYGKGHGHPNQANTGPITDAGYVVGNGEGERPLKNLRAAPGPQDGKTRRYDRQTLSGGRNDYGLGVAQSSKGGSFGFDQAAQQQVRGGRRSGRGGRRTKGGRRTR
jgi:hypothetical protein